MIDSAPFTEYRVLCELCETPLATALFRADAPNEVSVASACRIGARCAGGCKKRNLLARMFLPDRFPGTEPPRLETRQMRGNRRSLKRG